MPLIEGIWPKRDRVLGGTYELAVAACSLWVALSLASPAAVVTFVSSNLLGLAIFDNYLVRRPLALRRGADGTAFMAALIMSAPILAVIVAAHAPYSCLLCVATVVLTRSLMRPPPEPPRKPRLRRRAEWTGPIRR